MTNKAAIEFGKRAWKAQAQRMRTRKRIIQIVTLLTIAILGVYTFSQ